MFLMDVTNIVAENVKRARMQRKLTLDAAAALTDVSRSMLAQIEKGSVNPTISVLWKIANGYKVPFTSLVESEQESITVVRASNVEALVEDEGRYINYPIFAYDEESGIETYRISILPGGSLAAQPHLPGSQEYITVFAGELELTVGDISYQLLKGDSIRFNANVGHHYLNRGEDTAELGMIISYGESK